MAEGGQVTIATSVAHVWAIGDVAPTPHWQTGAAEQIESVPNATDQVRTLATGQPQVFHTVPWFWSDIGALKLQITGLPLGVDDRAVREGGDKLAIFHLKRGSWWLWKGLFGMAAVASLRAITSRRRSLFIGGVLTRHDLLKAAEIGLIEAGALILLASSARRPKNRPRWLSVTDKMVDALHPRSSLIHDESPWG